MIGSSKEYQDVVPGFLTNNQLVGWPSLILHSGNLLPTGIGTSLVGCSVHL